MSCDRVLVDTRPKRYCLETCSNSIAMLLIFVVYFFLVMIDWIDKNINNTDSCM